MSEKKELLCHLVNIRALAIAKAVDEHRGLDNTQLTIRIMEVNAEAKEICEKLQLEWSEFILVRDEMYARDQTREAGR